MSTAVPVKNRSQQGIDEKGGETQKCHLTGQDPQEQGKALLDPKVDQKYGNQA